MEHSNDNASSGPEEHPAGLNLAYDLLPATYDWMIQRLTTMENRVQALIILSASFLLTGPALVALAADNVSFDSVWFYLALAAAIVNLTIGVALRIWGDLALPEPRDVESEWISANAGEFKGSSVWWAREHFNQNEKIIRWKGRSSLFMPGAFLLETLFLTFWGMGQAGQPPVSKTTRS